MITRPDAPTHSPVMVPAPPASPIRARPTTSSVIPNSRTTTRAAPTTLTAHSIVGVAAVASGATMTAVP